MKRFLFPFLLLATLANAATNVDSVATAPVFTGSCDNVAKFALQSSPTPTNSDYYINSAVDLSQDMTMTWHIGAAGTFDGDGGVGIVSTDGNCLRPETLEPLIKQKVDQYQQILAGRTNPLIQQIGNDATEAASGTSKSSNFVKDFTMKGDSSAADDFFGGFLSEIKEPYGAAQTYIVLFFLTLALISMAGEWIFFNFGKLAKETNAGKVSTIEVMHRFVISVPILFIFFSGSGLTTRAQDIFASFVAEGSTLADALANKVHVTNAKYNIKEISSSHGISKQDLEKKVRGQIMAQEKAKVDQAVLSSCMETYNIDQLRTARKGSSDLIFPSSPAEMGGKTQFEFEQAYVKHKLPYSEAEVDQAPPSHYFSVQTCAASEAAYRNYVQVQAPKMEKYFDKLQHFDPEKLKYVVSGAMTKNITMGWTSIAMLPAQQAMQQSTSAIDAQIGSAGFEGVEFDFSLNGIQKFYATYENFNFNKSLESMTQRAAFLIVPGASGFYTTTQGMLKPEVDIAAAPVETEIEKSKEGADAVSGIASMIPGLGGVIGKILSTILGGALTIAGKVVALTKGAIVGIAPFYIATSAAKILVESLVFIIPMMVTAIVIVWWYVEVFAYMIMIPFAAAYALGENAKANILQFIIKGIGLAFKPMLIVVSVFLAVKGAAMLESITTGMITAQDLAMISQANTVLDVAQQQGISVTSPFDGWGQWLGSMMRAGLIQGILFIAVAITKVFVLAGIILKLPNFMLGLMNINADSNGGEAIASKISTMTKGI